MNTPVITAVSGFIIVLLMLPTIAPAQPIRPPNTASAPIRVIIQNEKGAENPWLQPSTFIAMITALGGLAALLVQRHWHRKDEAETRQRAEEVRKQSEKRLDSERQQMHEHAERERLLTHALDSLKWFEGKTQKRSIGISIVEGHWTMFPTLHETWTAVLANQAVYLLVESGQDDAAHERANLGRIQRLLSRSDAHPSDDQKEAIRAAIRKSQEGAGLRGISEDEYNAWSTLVGTE